MLVSCVSLRSNLKLVAGVWPQFLEKQNCCWPYAGAKNPTSKRTISINFIQHLRNSFSPTKSSQADKYALRSLELAPLAFCPRVKSGDVNRVAAILLLKIPSKALIAIRHRRYFIRRTALMPPQ